MLLSREVSIPSRKVLKSSSLHCFASTGCLTQGLPVQRTILARGLVKDRAHTPVPRRQKAA